MSYHYTSSLHENLSEADEILWEGFKRGGRGCYQLLYSKYLSALYHYAYKNIPDKEVVTEHVQDLFIDLWKYKDGLSPRQR